MSVTWIRADMAMLACLMTWQDDVSLDVSESSGVCMAHEVSTGMWRRDQKSTGVWRHVL